MAEGLAILGLVANIFQFIEQGQAILSSAKEVYTSGQSRQTRDVRLLLEDIKNTSDIINGLAPGFLSDDERAIGSYSAECDAIAAKLSPLADRLTARDNARSRTLESLRTAYRNVVKKDEVQKLADQLKDLDRRLRERLRNALDREAAKDFNLQLSSIISMMNEQDKSSRSLGGAMLEDLDRLRKDIMSQIKSTETVMSNLVRRLVEDSRKVKAHQNLLQSLVFPEIRQRYSDIDSAHKETLKWLFDPCRTSFPDWLGSGDGIYWVTGLAGSGKSTLMKYAYEQDMTHQLLADWAGHGQLVTAHFYFWNQGTKMQKSQQGLLQSLLFQILRTDVDLALSLCPDLHRFDSWTVQELHDVFDRVAKAATSATKFCFFIDGLDEYNGTEDEIIQTVKKLALCPSIKICASSRPWNRFQEAFGSRPELVVEKLTREDILRYIQAELEESIVFKAGVERDPRCRDIIAEVACRAQGVFLWVFLVVRDLKRDMQSQEPFEHLQQRVDTMPPTLDDYFQRIFDRIDPIYRQQTARLFLLALFTDLQELQPLPLMACECLELEMRDRNYALSGLAGPGSRSANDWEAYRADAEHIAITRLNDRCKDLLHPRINPAIMDTCVYHKHISFLHRTVRDFLRDNYQSQLEKNAGQFSIVHSYSLVLLSLFQRYPADLFSSRSEDDKTPLREGELVRWHAPELEMIRLHLIQFWNLALTNEACIADNILKEFAKTSTKFVGLWPIILIDGPLDRHPGLRNELLLMAWAISIGMTDFVRRNWKPSTARAFANQGLAVLSLALQPCVAHPPREYTMNLGKLGEFALNVASVRALLELGCDPNEFGAGIDFLHGYRELRRAGSGVRDEIRMWQSFCKREDDVFEVTKLLFNQGLQFMTIYTTAASRDQFDAFFMPMFGQARRQELWLIQEPQHPSEHSHMGWRQRISKAFGFT